MAKAKILPYINKVTGDLKALTRKEGKELNDDWERARVVTNEHGESVFRFELSSPVTGPDGRVHTGTAIVDLKEAEADDGVGITE